MIVRGFKKVEANLTREMRKMKIGSMAALEEAAIILRYDMDKSSPKIPVGRTGNLRQSWFTQKGSSPKGPRLVIGFSANYATVVHEMVDKPINWTRPGSGAKFLEAALNRNELTILQNIRKHTKA